MNTTPDARIGHIIAEETVQTVLLIIASVVATWLCPFRIPWQVSGDPCLVAAGATVVIVACLWLTRWRGLRAVNFERHLIAGFHAAMPLVYLTRYLFASAGQGTSYWFWVEALGVVVFAVLALLGLKLSPWFLATGIVVHGLAWDTWHYHNSTYIPDWYVIACLAVDLALGAYVAARVRTYQGHRRWGRRLDTLVAATHRVSKI
jgi:hypothetical protein